MKFHKEITSETNKIYDDNVTRSFYNGENHRRLSLMKQENIRIALQKKYNLSDIINQIQTPCGYCFKIDCSSCHKCILFEKMNNACDMLESWSNMIKAVTFKEFAKYHELWCKEFGLWQKGWK